MTVNLTTVRALILLIRLTIQKLRVFKCIEGRGIYPPVAII